MVVLASMFAFRRFYLSSAKIRIKLDLFFFASTKSISCESQLLQFNFSFCPLRPILINLSLFVYDK